MSGCVLVVAPHMDDEVLGCGGTMLWHRDRGERVVVLALCNRWTNGQVDKPTTLRLAEASRRIGERWGIEYRFSPSPELLDNRRAYPFFDDLHLEVTPAARVIGNAIRAVEPKTVYLPWFGDCHQDHRAAARAGAIATRMAGRHCVDRVLHYEVLSATEQSGPGDLAFQPSVFVDVWPYLEEKVSMMNCYEKEQGDGYPHARSDLAIRSLAVSRGVTVYLKAAEAFVLRREVLDGV